jgi:hypothetical protein
MGESAMNASALPRMTAVVASSCLSYFSLTIGFFPAATHFLLLAGSSSVSWMVRLAGWAGPLAAGVEVRYEVDGLLAGLVVRKGGHPDVIFSARDAGDDVVEGGFGIGGLEAQLSGDGVHQVDVEADDLAGGILVFIGCVRRVDADGDDAFGLDRRGHQGTQILLGGHTHRTGRCRGPLVVLRTAAQGHRTSHGKAHHGYYRSSHEHSSSNLRVRSVGSGRKAL